MTVCVVARSPEAKKLVAMQTTLYEIRDRIHRGENPRLFLQPRALTKPRDMSRRGD